MRAASVLLTAVVVLALPAGCDSPATTDAPPGAAATAPTAAPATPSAVPGETAADEAAVRQAFDTYHRALLARDFTGACAVVEPTTAAAVQAAAARQGLAAGSCAEAFASVYADPQSAAALDKRSRNIQITAVRVDGDVATVTYSAQAQGMAGGDRNGLLRRVDGRWLVQGAS